MLKEQAVPVSLIRESNIIMVPIDVNFFFSLITNPPPHVHIPSFDVGHSHYCLIRRLHLVKSLLFNCPRRLPILFCPFQSFHILPLLPEPHRKHATILPTVAGRSSPNNPPILSLPMPEYPT